MQSVKPCEIDITTIHYVERPRFRYQDIEHIDVAHFAVGDMDKSRDFAPQIEQGMQLDCRFSLSKMRPGKHGQTQVDGGGIKCINCVRQIDAKRFCHV